MSESEIKKRLAWLDDRVKENPDYSLSLQDIIKVFEVSESTVRRSRLVPVKTVKGQGGKSYYLVRDVLAWFRDSEQPETEAGDGLADTWTKAQIMALFGVTQRQVELAGFVSVTKGKPGTVSRYDQSKVIKHFMEQLDSPKFKKEQAEADLSRSRANMARLDEEERAARLLAADSVVDVMAGLLMPLKDDLLRLPSESGRLGHDPDIGAWWKGKITEVLTELSERASVWKLDLTDDNGAAHESSD